MPTKKVKTSRTPRGKKAPAVLNTEAEYREELSVKRKSPAAPEALPAFRGFEAEQKKKRQMIIWVAAITLLIFIGWIFSLKYSLFNFKPTPADQQTQAEWQKLKDDLTQSFASFKDNLAALEAKQKLVNAAVDTNTNQDAISSGDLDKIKQGLIAEATKDWVTYSNFDYNYSLKYPADWKQGQEGKSIIFTKGKEKITITIAPEIPRPALPDNLIEVAFLDKLAAKLYHDQSPKDGAPLDKVIATLADGKNDISLTGYGDTFNQMILTFKFIK